MRHPDEGTLRRILDEPAGVTDADRTHVAGCSTCLADLVAAQRDAARIGAVLDMPGEALDVDSAWQRLATTATGPRRNPVPTRRWRDRLNRPVIAVGASLALVTGAGAAAAADWFEVFRTEAIAPVELTRGELVALPDLSSYGDFRIVEEPGLREVVDAEAAAKVTGFAPPRPATLPQGVVGEPTYRAGSRVAAEFTFSTAKAQQTVAARGEALPAPPPGLDGARFRLVAGPGVVASWTSRSGLPALIVGRATAPTALSDGVPFATARDYLLSLPGMPDRLAAQLRSFGGDTSTLPLPIPAGQLRSRSTTVDGGPATLLTSRDGALAGVVWVRDGRLTAVAGSVSTDEVLEVARGLS